MENNKPCEHLEVEAVEEDCWNYAGEYHYTRATGQLYCLECGEVVNNEYDCEYDDYDDHDVCDQFYSPN